MYKLLLVFGSALTLFGCSNTTHNVEVNPAVETVVDGKFEIVGTFNKGTGIYVEEVRDTDSGAHYYLFRYGNTELVGVSEVYNQDGTIKITGEEQQYE